MRTTKKPETGTAETAEPVSNQDTEAEKLLQDNRQNTELNQDLKHLLDASLYTHTIESPQKAYYSNGNSIPVEGLYLRLARIQAKLPPVSKSGVVDFVVKATQKREYYTYADANDILTPVRIACGNEGIYLSANTLESRVSPDEAYVVLELTLTCGYTNQVHRVKTPEIYSKFKDKASAAAVTQALKTVILMAFMLATEDTHAEEAEAAANDSKSPKPAVQAEPRKPDEISAAQESELREFLKDYDIEKVKETLAEFKVAKLRDLKSNQIGDFKAKFTQVKGAQSNE